MSDDWRCAHCGRRCGSHQGHAFGNPVTFYCAEGRDNEAALQAGRPLIWDFGRRVEVPTCHVCRVPIPCNNSHMVASTECRHESVNGCDCQRGQAGRS